MTAEIHGSLAKYSIRHDPGQDQFFIHAEKPNTEKLALASERSPEREAERALGGFVLKSGFLAIVFGGLSLNVIKSIQKGRNGGILLIVEADQKASKELIENYQSLFEKTRLYHPGNFNTMFDLIETLSIEDLLGYRIVKLRGPVSIDEAFYAEAEVQLKKALSSRLSDLFTRLEFEARWVLNALSQLRVIDRARPVSSLFGKGKGMHALLVSSGPSLRSSLEWIKENQNNFFIATVDSAYRVLARSGIRPHLIMSLDSQAHTRKHFLGLPAGTPGDYPVLAADFVANPAVTLHWKGEMVLSFTAQFSDVARVVTPGCDYIERELIHEKNHGKIPGDVQSGGSVATSLFDLLRQMGFAGVTLIGQDLAYSWREIHSTGTHHTDIWLAKNVNRFSPLEAINEKVVHRRATIPAQSILGKIVPSDYILSLYRKWFEDAAEQMPGFLINATREGLPIAHTAQSLPHLNGQQKQNEALLEQLLQTPYLQSFFKDLPDFPEDYNEISFMKLIGRKYEIRNRRLQVEGKEKSEGLETKQREEQLRFWRTVKRRLSPLISSFPQ